MGPSFMSRFLEESYRTMFVFFLRQRILIINNAIFLWAQTECVPLPQQSCKITKFLQKKNVLILRTLYLISEKRNFKYFSTSTTVKSLL